MNQQTLHLPIYMDYSATTPVDPRVVDKMVPYLREQFGNPSSSHVFGQTAHEFMNFEFRADIDSASWFIK